jgi:dihydroneopterin aldolase/2-amino-4-hydroxy-6-hydroxymethyldihydropteridine diphosphokinase
MKTYTAYLGLGSNLGEREKFLTRAVRELQRIEGCKVIWASSLYETEPYGKLDQPSFLNGVLQVETTLEPPLLFAEAKRIEAAIGRSASEHWGPREIDIDILLYDGVVFEDEHLKVPHPDLERRKFVLVPLREIASDLVHPVSGLTVEEMAARCREGGQVRMSSHRILLA